MRPCTWEKKDVCDIEAITDDQWGEYAEQLVLYLVTQFWKRGWGSRQRGWAGPGGIGPEDVAQETIRCVIEGRRRYNPSAYEDFLDFLKHAGNSIMSHLARQGKGTKVFSLSGTPCEDDATTSHFEQAGTERDPEEECMSSEGCNRIKTTVLTHFADDPLVIRLLECLEARITKRADLAEYLDVDPKEIDNARKRLHRTLKTELGL